MWLGTCPNGRVARGLNGTRHARAEGLLPARLAAAKRHLARMLQPIGESLVGWLVGWVVWLVGCRSI